MLAEMYGQEVLVRFARSGYEALLDAQIWAEPPLNQPSLEEGDEELIDTVNPVGAETLDVPDDVPHHHTWWPNSKGPHV